LWTLDDLRTDVINGTLPAVSWVLPTPAQSEHPAAGSSPNRGGDFTAQVLDAVTANPELWSQTVFFLTFDENDGFFDHMPAPAVPSYDADGALAGASTVGLDGEYFSDSAAAYRDSCDTISGSMRPWGLGARVPMYIVSPWSKGGWVDSQVFDHTSIGMFIEKRFGISVDSISPWHRAVCGDLTSAFDFATPNDSTFPVLPNLSDFASIEAGQEMLPRPVPPTTAEALFQETGTRYSRALPYEIHTSARVAVDGTVSLIFSNTGAQGVVFHVYDKLHLDRIPRRCTVEAGKMLTDSWNATAVDDGNFDLWVYGSNGFVRSFQQNALVMAGAADATGGGEAPATAGATEAASVPGFRPEIQICYDPCHGQIILRIHNDGGTGGEVTVTANAYRADGPWSLEVDAGKANSLSWNLAASGHWYDFTVQSPGFSRRFAGRMETGENGVSDPAKAMGLVA